MSSATGATGVVARGRSLRSDDVLGRLLVAAVAVGYLVPLVVDSFVNPKGFRPITDAPPPPDATLELVSLLCNVLVLAACGAVVVLRLGRLRRLVGPILLLLAAWVVAVVGLVVADGAVNRAVVLFPAICAAVALVRPGAAVVRAVGWTVVTLVGLSLLMALLAPDAGLYFQGANQADEKFVWDYGILVGPFRSGNNFGLVLAVGLPFVLALRPGWVRVAGTVATVAALAVTFSRTSIVAAAAGAAVWAVVVLLPRVLPRLLSGDRVRTALPRLRAGLAAAALAVLGLVALALPFVTGSATAFNNRGGFWHEGVDAWLERPLLGWGADYYLQLARSADNLGGFAYHAHNQAAQLLVTGGLVLLTLVLAAVVWASVVAVRHASAGSAWPAAFLAAFLVSAWFEVPLGLVDRGMFYPAVLVPLCLLLAHGRDPHPALTDREALSPA